MAGDERRPYCRLEENGRPSEDQESLSRSRSGSFDLTVEGKSKVEATLAKELLERQTGSKWSTVLKWITTIIVGTFLLFLLTVSKISVIGLSQKLNTTAVGNQTDIQRQESNRSFVMLLLVLLIPNVFGLLRSIWVSGWRSDMPWPRKSSLLLVRITEIPFSLSYSTSPQRHLALFSINIIVMSSRPSELP